MGAFEDHSEGTTLLSITFKKPGAPTQDPDTLEMVYTTGATITTDGNFIHLSPSEIVARQQIQDVCNGSRPILQKLLNIKPKYGIDFSLDYVTHDVVMEVIHIEQDFDNIEEAESAKERLEHIINNTDWYEGAMRLYQRKHEWENLSSDDHSDYKAQFFGWERAFDNKKVF